MTNDKITETDRLVAAGDWGQWEVGVTCMLSLSVVSNSFATPWTVARQAPLSTGFSRQEYWSGLPLPSPGDIPNPGIKPMLLIAGRFFTI